MGFEMAESETRQREQTQQVERAEQGAVRTYDRWQLFHLDRLHRLTELNRQVETGEAGDEHAKGLKRAIFSVLLDCDAAGVGEEARKIVSGR